MVIAIVATILGGVITGAVGLVVDRARSRRAVADERQRSILQAAHQLLNASMDILSTAQMMRVTFQVRSGWDESFAIAARLRAPLDPMDTFERMMIPLTAAGDAVAQLWTDADQDVIESANELLTTCGSAFQLAIALPKRAGLARLGRAIRGVQWDEEQNRAWNEAAAKIGPARAAFASTVRRCVHADGLDLQELLAAE